MDEWVCVWLGVCMGGCENGWMCVWMMCVWMDR